MIRKTINNALMFFPLFALLVPNNKLLFIIFSFCFIIFCLRFNFNFEKNRINRNFLTYCSIFLCLFFRVFCLRWKNGIPIFDLLIVNLGVHREYTILLLGIVCALFSIPCLSCVLRLLDDTKQVGNDKNRITKTDYLLIIIISLFIASFDEVRPFSIQNINVDSAVFYYIGKSMTVGKIPYVDLFDHKGILLYLIQYVAALISGGSLFGIWLTNLIAIFLSFILFVKIYRLFSTNNEKMYITLILLSITFVFGLEYHDISNLSEVYALPAIAFATFVFIKFLKYHDFSSESIIALGCSFTYVFFLRSNMVGVWLVYIPIVVITLIKKGQYKDLLKCTMLFFVGIVLVLLPLMAYFVWSNSLKDMIDYYFLYNFQYTQDSGGLLSVIRTAWVLNNKILVPYLVLYNIIERKRTDSVFCFNLICYLVCLYIACMSGRMYPHYLVVLFPFIEIFLINFVECCDLSVSNKKTSYLIAVLIVVSALCYKPLVKTQHYVDDVERFIIENTDKNDDVFITGNHCKYYINTDRKTENKYFYSAAIKNDEMEESFIKEFEKNMPDFIICTKSKQYRQRIPGNQGSIYRFFDTLKDYKCLEYEQYYVYIRE